MNELTWFEWISVIASGAILDYGAPALGLAFLIGALGLPIPGTVLVLGAGALVQQGILNGPETLGLSLAGVVLGDSLSYGLGRFAAPAIIERVAQTRSWQEAASAFDRQGRWLVYLSRWLLTPLALPVNWLSGSRLAFRHFLAYDAAGELTWLILFGSLGYFLGGQSGRVAEYLSTLSSWLLVLLGVLLGLAWVAHRLMQRTTGPLVKWEHVRQRAFAPARPTA